MLRTHGKGQEADLRPTIALEHEEFLRKMQGLGEARQYQGSRDAGKDQEDCELEGEGRAPEVPTVRLQDSTTGGDCHLPYKT